MTKDRKMVMQLFFEGNLVKGVQDLSNLWNPSMFKDVIDFREPTLKFFGLKLKFFGVEASRRVKGKPEQNRDTTYTILDTYLGFLFLQSL